MSAVASTSGASVKMVWASNDNSSSNSNSTVPAHSGSNRHRSMLDSSSSTTVVQHSGDTTTAAASVYNSNFISTDGNIDYSVLHSGTEDTAGAIASTWQYFNSLNTESDISDSSRLWREFQFKSETAGSSNSGFVGSLRSSVSYWLQQLFQSTGITIAGVSDTSEVTNRRLDTNSTVTNTPLTATVTATEAAAAAKPVIAAAVLPAVPVVVWPENAIVDAVTQSEMTLLMPTVSISPRITANGKDCVFLLNFQANPQVSDSDNSNSSDGNKQQPFTAPAAASGSTNAGSGSTTTATKNSNGDEETLFDDSDWVNNFTGEIVGINCDFYASIDASAKRTNWEKVSTPFKKFYYVIVYLHL
jgi:hypothetical protein